VKQIPSGRSRSADSLAEKVEENPPEVGELVYVFGDERQQAYDLVHKSNRISTSLQAVPLGIVTIPSTPWPTDVPEHVNPPDYPEHDNLVAVRRLADGVVGEHSELFQEAGCIPL
jgi:hypothetical protein